MKKEKRITFKMATHVILKTIKLRSLVMSRQEKNAFKNTDEFKAKIACYERNVMELAPVVEGRIICLNKK